MHGRILLVDDEPEILTLFSKVLAKKGYAVSTASNGMEALVELERDQCAIVITDLKMPKMDGMELLKRVKRNYPEVEILVLTGFGTIESAVEAMKKGAFNYFTKPYNIDEVLIELKKIFQLKRMRHESNYFREEFYRRYEQGKHISKNPKMQEVFKTIKKAAPSNATVLVQGETGTGKELAAYFIHSYSPRRLTLHYPRGSWRVSFSDTKRVPSRAPSNKNRAGLKWPTGGPSFLMRSDP
jgi:two-component system NtrC family response regulator